MIVHISMRPLPAPLNSNLKRMGCSIKTEEAKVCQAGLCAGAHNS